MPKEPDLLPAGVRISDTLLLAQLQSAYPADDVKECLRAEDCETERTRELPNELIPYFAMMLSVYRPASQKEVLRCMSEGLSRIYGLQHFKITGKSGISQARARVSPSAMKAIFDRCTRPISRPGSKGSYYRGLLLTIIDGTQFDLDDCPINSEYFGRSSNQSGECGNPKATVVGLMEAGSRVTFGLSIGKYSDSENSLVMDLIHLLKPGFLCLADILYMSFDIFKAAKKTGADLLFRARQDRKPTFVEELPDGSSICLIHSSKDTKHEEPIKVRVIDFNLQVKKGNTVTVHRYKLITTLLDHEKYPINELAAVYRERWEIETMLDEVKTHMLESKTLRSRTPDLVKQEIYGLFMAHNVVRISMFEAARQARIDPDVLSFTHSKNVVEGYQKEFGSFPP